ncbi:MAG TPA: glycoside hydrolase family 3 C-terminal domain-containing protein [Aquihabitans sp.]|nr:glycoside hydrolase family 3 C-terminal domain-containing protein [Aquihabitans sp.]
MTERFDVPALLAELTLEEKASLVSGSGFWWTRRIERLGIPSIMVSDGPHGLRKQDRSADHVGIGGSVPATCFPTASALGSTWDRDLVREVGEAIGAEARAQGLAVVLGPGVNLKRDPRCGRNFEYLSEDPLVAGELGAAMVQGIQSRGVGTSLKHYAANNQETDRQRVSADIDDRTLRELYLSNFERVVRDAGPWTVMCSYNRINGTYASQDPWLLTEVLRDEWGFDGLVVSDWGAVDDPVAAVRAGLDLEMPSTGGASARTIASAVRAGELDEAVLDTAIARLLQLIERATPGLEAGGAMDDDAHHALARRAAADGTVLLRNDHDLLPIELEAGRIAVIGAFATQPRFQGAGSSKVNPTSVDAALDELRAALPAAVELAYAPGFGIDEPRADRGALRADAVAAATGADVVVCFLGLPPSFESEGFDRTSVELPAEQVEVLASVAAANPNVVVVLANGGMVAVSGWEHHARALVEGWLGGQAGAGGVVDVLVGAVNPSGRLAETIVRRLEDTPSFPNFPGEDRHVRYGEGLLVGYRHHDAVDGEVSYPFGHGLSYTTFEHRDLRASVARRPSGGWRGDVLVDVAVTVANTGDRAGKEIVQVYVEPLDRPVPGPVRELRAFAKVDLDPGATAALAFELTERDLARWARRAGRWVVDPGRYRIWVGASSRDLRAQADVAIDGPPVAGSLDRHSTVAEWLEHPVGHEVLMDALGRNPRGDLRPMLADPEQLRMLGSFPLPRLLTMMGAADDGGLVADLLAAAGGSGER